MASHSLAQHLYSLRLQNGRPDFERRKIELDDLIHYLSSAEISHLVNLLRPSTIRHDKFVDLPNEIILAIMNYLDLEDVVTARSVSHKWYYRWTAPEICFGIAERYFPDVLIRLYMSLPDDQKKATKAALSEWACKRAVDVVKCQRGRSLRTGERKVYMKEEREPILKWWLTDKLLIANTHYPNNILTAWNLGSDEMHTIRLSGPCLNLTARGNYVGFQINSETFIWRVGGRLTSVKAPKAPASFLGLDWWPFHLLFHPINEDHYFLFYRAINGEGATFQVLVQEYVGGEARTICHSKLATAVSARGAIIMDGTCLISYHVKGLSKDSGKTYKTDRDVGYTGPCYHQQIDQGSTRDPLTVVNTLTFDIFAKTFSTRSYHIHSNFKTLPRESSTWEDSINRSCIWRDQLLLPVYPTGSNTERKPIGIDDILLLAVQPCDRIQPAPNVTPLYVQTSPDEKQVLFLEADPEFHRYGVSFCWAMRGVFAEKTRLILDPFEAGEPNTEGIVRGDDDFVVLFSKNGYVVWSFNEAS
ncbi:hypothetical protein B7463_g2761, partial [Scytalidium lignicola]